ncbi:MAG TPA: hypothetical protein VEK06_03910, partial [Myxococcota bacterium]|nr:hypothetical protein [Myxococcota bacterium]
SLKRLRGVAILIVLVSLALMMALVTELSSKEFIYYKLALNERDALQAEALAQSGANFAQLILAVQEPLQGYLTKFAEMGVQLPAYTVWELMPIDSDLLKGITEGYMPSFGLGTTEEKVEEKEKTASSSSESKKAEKEEKKGKEVKTFGPYEAPEGGFGAFVGSFSTEIEDEERKISIRKWAKPGTNYPRRKLIADEIFRLLNKPENVHLFDGTYGDNKNISPAQLVGYIYDYLNDEDGAVDVTAPAQEWGRSLVGNKKSYYDPNTPEIQPRRAIPDSEMELRLIPGVTDAIYHLLSKYLTIYAENDKINILTASDAVLGTIFYLCAKNRDQGQLAQPGFSDELIASWKKKRDEGNFKPSAEGVISFLEENRVEVDKEECTKSVGSESKTFTVKST